MAARITLFAGHYGSGKTNVALNYARALRRAGSRVAIADLDIVNPYFRTKDSAVRLAREGIDLVVSDYANSNVDFPSLPKEIYSVVADRSTSLVIDVGGDDRGALALGRYVPDILAEDDYDMLAVVNFARPLTRTPEDVLAVMREIESAAGLPFTGLVNNTNLGPETTPGDIRDSIPKIEALAAACGLTVRFTSVDVSIAPSLDGALANLMPIDIQRLYYQFTPEIRN